MTSTSLHTDDSFHFPVIFITFPTISHEIISAFHCWKTFKIHAITPVSFISYSPQRPDQGLERDHPIEGCCDQNIEAEQEVRRKKIGRKRDIFLSRTCQSLVISTESADDCNKSSNGRDGGG